MGLAALVFRPKAVFILSALLHIPYLDPVTIIFP